MKAISILITSLLLLVSIQSYGSGTAGPNQTVCLGAVVSMAAAGTGTWSALISNPAITVITNITSPTTTISGFTQSGNYKFIWNPGIPDTLTVTVETPLNISSKYICLAADTVALIGGGLWTSSPGNPSPTTFIHISNDTTLATGLINNGFGSYIYMYISSNACGTDSVLVSGNYCSTWSYILACPGSSNDTVHTNVSGAGIWSALPGNPSVAIIDSSSAPSYAIFGFSAVGSYGFVWTTNSGNDTLRVTVNPGPIANYNLPSLTDTLFTCPPTIIIPFIDSSINAISYHWDFGDGTPDDTTKDPIHFYTLPGSYPVTETVTSALGCKDSITRYTIHIGGPIITLSDSVSTVCPCTIITYTINIKNPNGYDSVVIVTGGGNPQFWGFGPNNGYYASNVIAVTYCNGGIVRPIIYAGNSISGCFVIYDSLIAPIHVFGALTLSDSVTNLSCYGEVNGSICINATGGSSYSYLWNDNQASSCASGLPVGNYTVTVTDINTGCTASLSDIIRQPSQMAVNITTTASCDTNHDGSIQVLATGGTPPYTYTWAQEPTDTIDIATGLAKGMYYVTVMDANGCSVAVVDSVLTDTCSHLGIYQLSTETLHIQPNPAHDKVLISAGNIIRVLSITDVMGQQVMKDASLNAMSKNVDISAFDSGIYIVEVETDRGLGVAKLVIER